MARTNLTPATNARCFKLRKGMRLFAILSTDDAQTVGLVIASSEEEARDLYINDTVDADERAMFAGWFEEGDLVAQVVLNRVIAPANFNVEVK